MRYLLDTHVLLWYSESPDKLSKKAIDVIFNSSSQLYVSIVSLWEFCIKHGSGKLPFAGGFPQLCAFIEEANIEILPITTYTLSHVVDLPYPNAHRDPFDRLLIATAKTEDMTILTADEAIYKYDVKTLWQ